MQYNIQSVSHWGSGSPAHIITRPHYFTETVLYRVLAAVEFIAEVQAYAERQLAEAEEKERKKGAKAAYAKALEVWTKAEESRKAEKAARTADWKKEVEEWEEERDLAKQEKRKARWKKPVLGKFPKAAPKPKAPKASAEVNEVDEDEDENSGEVILGVDTSFSSVLSSEDD